MRRLDWNRYVPLGINGRKVRNGLLLVLGFGLLVSFGFLSRLFDARDELYEWVGRTRVLRPGAVMPDYPTLLRGTFWGLGAAAAGMVVLAAAFYACHYQGGRSIYTEAVGAVAPVPDPAGADSLGLPDFGGGADAVIF